MDKVTQISCLSKDLDKLISRYAKEFDLTHGEVLGALELLKHRILKQTDEIDGE